MITNNDFNNFKTLFKDRMRKEIVKWHNLFTYLPTHDELLEIWRAALDELKPEDCLPKKPGRKANVKVERPILEAEVVS